MRSAAKVFVDSNVILYDLDERDPTKRAKVGAAIDELGHRMVISIQVLQEVYANATRKMKLPPQNVRAVIEQLSKGNVVEPNAAMVLRATDTSERNQISFYDAMIVEAAVAGRCTILLTEDLNHGQVIKGVKIVNPLR
jgi:predicted nucleic acid-binding protein